VLTVAVLRELGVTEVTVSEPLAGRRELARRVGASSVIEPSILDKPELPMDVVARAFDVAFECSGRAEAMEDALANLARAGTLVLCGTGMRRPRLDPNRIILNELTVTGTVEYTPDDFRTALDLLASGRLPAGELIEPEDQPLSRVQWAMEQLSSGELTGKVMVIPRA
jgi:threonine dehydrogenase-like Zn-dependent dehydrogenase